ncbi:hypothetical protein MTBPR1_140011 [Candidatus Terasakiella magnetica]|uniref:Uncharacterized protein n=1 Tax=Candidatus Terasakiella magnetica TaxID=1867952 RepID=A0A1C3RF27_9PROT|nr:hypothetical protein MTBPR1_140011 [Candidatus Terasakiella magnetica]
MTEVQGEGFKIDMINLLWLVTIVAKVQSFLELLIDDYGICILL